MSVTPSKYLLIVHLTLCFSVEVPAQTSRLWGREGELWNPVEGDHTKLLDFTEVGYRKGEVLPPVWPVGVNVRDFGAVGDGVHDDTDAFVNAIAAAEPNSAVFVPAGRYTITQQIDLDRNGIVLRGEDMYRTVLWLPHFLTEVNPYVVADQEPHFQAASYDANGNSYDGRMIADLGPPHDKEGNPVLDLKQNWPPRGHANAGGFLKAEEVTQVGVENLTLEFRDHPKGWHWEDIGADGILFHNVSDGWIRNVQVRNADHSITLRGCTHVSVINILLDAYTLRPGGPSGAADGHAGIRVGEGCGILIHNVRMTGQYIHDIMINGSMEYCVFSRISGFDLKLDHHSLGGKHALFTEIDHGKGTRPFSWSQWETYWGLKSQRPLHYDDVRGSRKEKRNVVVGMHTNDPSSSGEEYWHETIDPHHLTPPNLYLAQMRKRGKPLPEVPFPEKAIPAERPRDFMPVADSTVDPASEENLGGDWKLEFRDGKSVYLKFDLRETGLSSVQKATLHVFDGDPPKYNHPFEGRMMHPDPNPRKRGAGKPRSFPATVQGVEDDSWGEFTINGSNAPAASQTVAEFSLGARDWVEIDLTDYVNRQLAGEQIVSLQLRSDSKSRLRSSESSHAPYLTLTP